ncbi:alpha-L-fucosidase [Sphingomonas sp. S1-29]|uniref:alpha-L-fucosidase n=1 Tax=Sphingomonas sp. S1-29 TaxID=2991074 RepID=UPI00223FD0E4|nr:alpha-L-fucosidase [Sphingomonas sp. S1-29]UZK70292.1 alpha-L-fucosidase [Sphingomonas sp. S1-29]
MKRRAFLAGSAALSAATAAGAQTAPGIQANWSSLAEAYSVPEWFRDAKFGIWGHWGPQCQPEAGDWYGRQMYQQGNRFYDHHRSTYGHPADTGFLDIIGAWTGEAWDPGALVRRYKAAGARYIVGMACHHDNLDLFDSPHPWNSTRVGPRRDIVGGWEKAIRGEGLRFGVSNHASHAWHWWQTAYGYDPEGPRAGQRYDAARLTKAGGRGTWWDGLDPQALYTGAVMAPPDGFSSIAQMEAWTAATSGRWMEFAPAANPGFVTSWLARQKTLIERYNPDLVYFDDYGLPFGSVGLEALAHYYNHSVRRTGRTDVVLTAKVLSAFQRQAMVEDIERGFSDRLRDEPWQTCTCIGDWHYNRARYLEKSYVPAIQVLQRLADVVSKNGNLLLSIPLRGDGTIDSEEERIVDQIGAWLRVNGSAIYDTRPWRIYGEGPTDLSGGMHNEDQAAKLGAHDVRFTTAGGALNVILLGWPDGPVTIAALGTRAAGRIERATLLGGGEVAMRRSASGLMLTLPPRPAGGSLPVVRLEGSGLA